MIWFKKGDRVALWHEKDKRLSDISGTVIGVSDPYIGIRVNWDTSIFGPGIFNHDQLGLIPEPNDILKDLCSR